ncbi:MAG: SAM-dependent methyltransferase [Clostridium sp.]
MPDKQDEIKEKLDCFFNEHLERMICSNPRVKDDFIKMVIRPVLLKDAIKFQVEEFTEKQAFHKNLEKDEAILYVMNQLEHLYRNAELTSMQGTLNLLISKKGTVTIKEKKKIVGESTNILFGHNRKKQYILEEGIPVPFLVDLGVMTSEGMVVKAKYDKFRQINRFLEFIEDVLPRLDKNKETTIIDFGCGKSYLTFAMYYYLKELKGYPIQVVGLDLKKDVITLCNKLSETFGFENLHFYHGDIAGYEGVTHVDMVVTLHACDTATDYAIEKAIRWGAEVILSVPCCQHELNAQISNELLKPILQYGLLKERISALLTDGIRAELLEQAGYRTQILEFIDMEHTPKNIMIRAVKQGRKKDGEALEHMIRELGVEPTLYKLLHEGNQS